MNRDGRVELEPAPRKVRIFKKGKVFVAVPEDPSEPLTAEVVLRTQETVRERQTVLDTRVIVGMWRI